MYRCCSKLVCTSKVVKVTGCNKDTNLHVICQFSINNESVMFWSTGPWNGFYCKFFPYGLKSPKGLRLVMCVTRVTLVKRVTHWCWFRLDGQSWAVVNVIHVARALTPCLSKLGRLYLASLLSLFDYLAKIRGSIYVGSWPWSEILD
jgi:hypothetical protein